MRIQNRKMLHCTYNILISPYNTLCDTALHLLKNV